jgi:hypothetical protein
MVQSLVRHAFSGGSLMPLHDWSQLEGWDGMHQLWLVELFHWIKPRLPAGFRAYLGTVPTVAIGVPGERPDIHVRQGVKNDSASSNGLPPGAGETADELEVEVAVAVLEPSKALFIEREGCLISVVELISPGNNDRDSYRATSGTRYAGYLLQRVNLLLIDVHRRPLSFSFADFIAEELKIPEQTSWPAPMAVSYRIGDPAATGGSFLGIARKPLTIGQPLPSMRLPLGVALTVSVDLEQTYMRAAADVYLT